MRERGRSLDVMQMTRYRKTNKDIKPKGRKTPYDVKNEGTFAEKPRKPKSPPRSPTVEETRANNYAKMDFSSKVSDLEPWLPVFKAELEEMNRGKRGRPYGYPDSFIVWIVCYMTYYGMSYRDVVGNLSVMLRRWEISMPSYSRLCERAMEPAYDLAASSGYGNRILMIRVCNNVSNRVRSVGLDSTGISLSEAGLWREEVWGREEPRGWLKLHALSDTDTGEIIAYAVTEKRIGDTPLLPVLVGMAVNFGHVFNVLYADGAYSSDGNWKFVSGLGMDFVTSFRSDTRPKNNGCPARGAAARLWCSLPYDEWVVVSGYGTRWKCECVFSTFKTIFPETVSARIEKSIVFQMGSRVHLFNGYKKTRAEIMKVTGNGVAVA
jgi:hypothetical protein